MLKLSLVFVCAVLAPVAETLSLLPIGSTENGNSHGRRCAFPFTYQGVSHYECIMSNHNRPWCSTTYNFEEDGEWGECLRQNCIRTEGGNGGKACCHFPFTYEGKTHHHCIDTGYANFWCPVSEDYDKHGAWGECKLGTCIKTEGGNSDGAKCHFPWTYKGQQMNRCIKTGYHKMWCGTTRSYDSDGKWGECVPDNDICNCNPCKNGGSCMGIGQHYMCHCQDGFGGRHCEDGGPYPTGHPDGRYMTGSPWDDHWPYDPHGNYDHSPYDHHGPYDHGRYDHHGYYIHKDEKEKSS